MFKVVVLLYLVVHITDGIYNSSKIYLGKIILTLLTSFSAKAFKCIQKDVDHGLIENTKAECDSLKHPYCQYDDKGHMDCGRFEEYYIPFDYCLQDYGSNIYDDWTCKCKCRDSLCNMNKHQNETKCIRGVVFRYPSGSVTPLKEGEKRKFFKYMEENFNGRYIDSTVGFFDVHKDYTGVFGGREKGRPRKGIK